MCQCQLQDIRDSAMIIALSLKKLYTYTYKAYNPRHRPMTGPLLSCLRLHGSAPLYSNVNFNLSRGYQCQVGVIHGQCQVHDGERPKFGTESMAFYLDCNLLRLLQLLERTCM